jgi:hypothetical protein
MQLANAQHAGYRLPSSSTTRPALISSLEGSPESPQPALHSPDHPSRPRARFSVQANARPGRLPAVLEVRLAQRLVAKDMPRLF